MQSLNNEQLQKAYRYAMSLVNDHEQAKDIVHSAYVKLLEKKLSHIENPYSYFLRCIRNTFIDQKRLDDRWVMVEQEQAYTTTDIGLGTLEVLSIQQNMLSILWAEFSPLERELLYLWAVEEYTIKEISELTGIARGTLLSKIHRIRKKVASQPALGGVEYETAN